MPLDPFFDERLRLHRKYLFDQALSTVRTRLATLTRFLRTPSAPVEGTPAEAPVARPDRAERAAKAQASAALGPRARARARHRRSALAWDRSELRTVGTPGPEVRTVEHQVEVPGHPTVRVRIYYPDVVGHAPVPAVLAFFGGAFRIGGIDYPTTDAAFRRRTVDAHVAVAAVDYSLAPEHRYPVQVEQAYAALLWLFGNAPELAIDPMRIGVLGISAGGNIAATVALMNRDRAGLPLRLQILEVPVVDLTGHHLDLRAVRGLGIPRPLALRELRSVALTYLPHPDDGLEPYASPLRAASHEGLPPAVILTAEYDPLRGDGDAYGYALRRAGVDASVVRYQGVTHDVAIFTAALPAARRWHDDVVAALRRLHA
ncbi:alpha/beta hydrolase [Microbacterium deminutum]|uniref:Alpha/beta hydrolase n=1 Tax=Microbacterium deminutum TaxID=344164 RepID=A0ABP5C1Y5_9MICO